MKFVLATREHDAQLRALAASAPMPGWVRLLFAREPSYFDGVGVQGHENQVVALLDGHEVVGSGCRSIRRVFLDGRAGEFGYLSALRSKPRVRLGTLLGRGYRFLHELHGDGRVPGYLTTIVEHNQAAIDVLTSGRAGLPFYLPFGRCYSYAIPLRRGARHRRAAGIDIRRGSEVGAQAVTSFLAEHGAAKQFFPAVDVADFGRPHLRDLGMDDFHVAVRGNAPVGAVAAWDQRRFRQEIVAGYTPALRVLRPLVSAACRVAGYRPLPAPGCELNMAHLAFLCARDNDPAIFALLLDEVRAELAASDLHFLCLALHESDGLNGVLTGVRHLRYVSRLYIACWQDTRAVCEGLGSARVPHVEVSML